MDPVAIQKAMDEAYAKFKDIKEGKNADYIKELAKVDPNIFGIAIVTTDVRSIPLVIFNLLFPFKSISKVFTMARVIEEQGPKAIMDKIGVDATGSVSIPLWL